MIFLCWYGSIHAMKGYQGIKKYDRKVATNNNEKSDCDFRTSTEFQVSKKKESQNVE